MSKILVTGSEGLIGAALCRKLEKKYKIVHYDLKLKKNILNKKQFKKNLVGCVGVIHLARESRVPRGFKYPVRTIKNNVVGTGNILGSIKEIDPKIWCIYGISREVYGEKKKKFKETDLLSPINVYATTKYASELLMRNFCRNYGIETFVVRFSNVYGGLNDHKDRVIPKFMIQGGDPNTKNPAKNTWGTGGPGYNIKAEFNSRSHLRGIVSMARSSDPDSAGSQFFIVTSDSTFLDRQYTVFGQVVNGIDVADKIVNLPRDGNDCPLEEAKMLQVTISDT